MTMTKQNWLNRGMAVLLAVMMLLSMVPMTAFAVDLTMREQVEAKLAEVEALNEEDYTPESWEKLMNLYTQIKNGIGSLTDEQLDQYGSVYITGLDNAIAGLEEAEKEPTMREQVEAKLAEVEALNEEDYTPESWEKLMNLYTQIKNGIGSLTDEQLDQYGSVYITGLDNTIAGLEEAEKESTMREQVEAKLAEVEALNEEDYTPESWEKLMNLYTQIKNGIGSLTDEQLDQYGSVYITGLDNAIAGLEEAEKESTMREQVEAKLAEVEALNEEDYTPESWNDLQEIIGSVEAQLLLLTDDQLAEQGAGLLSQIETARDALIKNSEYIEAIINNEIDINKDITFEVKESNNSNIKRGFSYFAAHAENDESGLKITYRLNIALFEKMLRTLGNGDATNIQYLDDSGAELIFSDDGHFTICYSSLDEYTTGKTIKVTYEYSANTTNQELDGADGTLDGKSWRQSTLTVTLIPDIYNEPLTFTDPVTGVSLLTSTKYYPQDADFVVEKITETEDGDPHTDPWANMMMHLGASVKSADMYTFYLKIGNEKITEFEEWSATIIFPINSEMNKDNVELFYNQKSGSTFNYGYWSKYSVIDGDSIIMSDDDVAGYYSVYETIDMNVDGSSLNDGTYSVNIVVWHMTNDQASMANKGIVSPAILVVKDGVKTIFFDMQAVSNMELNSYMTELWIYDNDVTYSSLGIPQGNMYQAIVSEYYKNTDDSFYTDEFNKGTFDFYPKSVYFVLPNDSSEFPVRFRVPVMDLIGGGDFAQDARFRIDYSSIVKISDETSDAPIKDALNEEIAIVDTLEKEDWTYSSWIALTKAYNAAKALLDNDSATVAEMTSAHAVLRTAIDNLVSGTVDTSKLEALITEAEKYKADDYTADTFGALTAAITNAKATLNDDASTQVEIDTAKDALQTAVNGLKTKDSEKLDINNLPDGKYILYAEMFKTDRTTTSMSNGAINHNVWLEVIDGEYYLTIQFKGLAINNDFGYLKDLFYFDTGYTYNQYGVPQGALVAAEVLGVQKDSEGNIVVDQYNTIDTPYPEMLRIKLVDKASADYVPLQVFVPIMEAIADETGTQPVLMKLDWTKIAVDDGSVKPDAPVEQSPAVDYADADTGVKVNADKGVFEADTVIDVTEVTSGNDYNKAAESLSDVGKKFKLYNVAFADGEGNAVAPNGTIKLSIPVPNGYDTDNLFVYRINTDGTKTRVNGTVADGYFTVVTKNAGTYALVEAGSTETDNGNDNQGGETGNGGNNGNTDVNSPQTGDTSNMGLWFALMIASLGAMLVTLKLGFKRKSTIGE